MDELLSARYELGDILGSGGMGAVYRAHDTRLGRPVAIKVLRAGPLADDVSRARMRSEARLAASILHPGVAQIYDYEEDGSTHGGMAYIAMQLIEGRTLAELMKQGPMAPEQVMSVVMQVADALQAAHETGIVHRDLKPANIMVTPTGRTVLVDFGIARSPLSEPLTDTGSLLGTADYLSPEQAAGRTATPQSDLYALGVVAYHCLSGVSPFRRESPVATALAHLQEDLPPVGDEVPAPVRDLIASLSAKAPEDRPSTAAAVALLAAAAGASERVVVGPSAEPPVGVDVPSELVAEDTMVSAPLPTGTSDPVAHPAARRPRPRTLYAGLGVAVVLAALGLQRMQADEAPVVPSVVGLDVKDATAKVRDAGLTVRRESVDVAGKPAGLVVDQSPERGDEAGDDDVVELSVVSGKIRVSARSVIGTTYAKASAGLEKLGFVVARKDVTQAADAGEVVALDKSGRLPDGTTITLSVAVAPVVVRQPTVSSPASSGPAKSSGTPVKAKKSHSKTKTKTKAKAKSRKKK
ncbi:MAG: serine/threonine protein kinase [Aeromicrobium sp.]|uniref:protein kinase domain-containing protein n=1 Tax=Aeromicrobium sp. TaxID=1871063 RepID=UPI002606C99F|nr:protein kinase [Aeromicrobium sp.]MCW2790071.1 serine/threonine protein kinase [Aeromicrobium sp.]MCW2823735.1 serine/threonine protein kinase [Aeromicrobium sp.]